MDLVPCADLAGCDHVLFLIRFTKPVSSRIASLCTDSLHFCQLPQWRKERKWRALTDYFAGAGAEGKECIPEYLSGLVSTVERERVHCRETFPVTNI